MDNKNNFATLDTQRQARTGLSEAVFCQGKTSLQVAKIMEELSRQKQNVIGTRATIADFEETKKLVANAKFYEEARIIAIENNPSQCNEGIVAVVTAGTADMAVAKEALVVAKLLGNKTIEVYDVGVAGIHRLFEALEEIRKAKVIIVVAGMEGALPSVVAGLVDIPVIAVPTSVGYGANLQGVTALLAMVNSCAPGIGVVNIDNGYGAACLATKINKQIKKG